jgi:DNA integrity scanning protein DisA with diadenylate cyclase activity
MSLPPQTVHLLQAAAQLARLMSADAVLLLTETDLDWEQVKGELNGCRLLVAAHGGMLVERLKQDPSITVLDVDPSPMPTRERLSLALLEAIANEQLKHGAHVVALYNGVEIEEAPDQIDSLSVIHLGEHLERLSAQELRRLDTQVPLESLKAVVDLATELGREGREGKPVGTMFVVGDTRKVMSMSRVLGFDPVRGYSRKEICKLDGALIVNRDGTVEAAARYIDVLADGITLSKGLGSRHWAAAAISKRTRAVAIVVSESTGVVRIFQNGEVVLHIEPFSRPMVWRPFHMEVTEDGAQAAGTPAESERDGAVVR